MGDIGYPLDLVSPVRHVVTEIEGAAPVALSVEALVAGYRHPNTGDISRVKSEEGMKDETEANEWLIRRAISDLLVGSKRTRGLVADNGGYRFAEGTKIGNLRYRNRVVQPILNLHKHLRDPFDPMTGEFSENIRRVSGKDKMEELRESLKSFGWLPEFPAIKDERGVVIVGHRRLAVAEELPDVEPVIKTIRFGVGDEADARRLKLAIASNLGAKPFTQEERARIAQYLYGDRGWSQERIAEALNVSVGTINADVRDFSTAEKSGGKGRPRNLTDEQQREIIRKYFEEGKTIAQAEAEARGWDEPKQTPSASAKKVIDQERGRREERAKAEGQPRATVGATPQAEGTDDPGCTCVHCPVHCPKEESND